MAPATAGTVTAYAPNLAAPPLRVKKLIVLKDRARGDLWAE